MLHTYSVAGVEPAKTLIPPAISDERDTREGREKGIERTGERENEGEGVPYLLPTPESASKSVAVKTLVNVKSCRTFGVYACILV